MAPATIGSDTGGPTDWQHFVELSASNQPRPGCRATGSILSQPLMQPMSNSADCAAIMDSIMAGGDGAAETPFPLPAAGTPAGYLFDGLMMRLPPALMRLSRAQCGWCNHQQDQSRHPRRITPANNPKALLLLRPLPHRDRLQSNAHGV